MPKVFRECPPQELLELLLKSTLNLQNLKDSTWFSKSSINIQSMNELFPLLEPYYMPCKARQFLYAPLTRARAITILRQLLTVCGYELTAQEKTCGGVKGMWYQIAIPKISSNEGVTLEFS